MKSLVVIQQRLETLVTEPTNRSRVFAAAVAAAIAGKLSLPSAAVDSPNVFFADNFITAISGRISDINEAIIFDVRAADAFTRKFWFLRYNAAFPSSVMPCCDNGFVSTFLRVVDSLAPEEEAFLNTYCRQISELAMLVSAEIVDY